MKSSSIFESVFKVNKKYSQMQNATKELFFKCLEEGQDVEYFKNQLEKIWGRNDIPYLEEQIIDYMAYLHETHTNEKLDKSDVSLIELATLGGILATNKLFQKVKENEYKTRVKSFGYENNKEEYLKKIVPKYTSDIKPYRNKDGEVVRFVKPSTYNSMVYNTALTRNGWVQTINDGENMGIRFYYIPYHPFSCPHCIEHQEVSMTREECLRMLGTADEGAEEILHPNCKCVLNFFTDTTQLKSINFEEAEDQYHIREKILSLQLKKEEIKTDLNIYKSIDSKWQNSQAEIDRTKAKLQKVNDTIKDLQKQLPTEALQKQVIAR